MGLAKACAAAGDAEGAKAAYDALMNQWDTGDHDVVMKARMALDMSNGLGLLSWASSDGHTSHSSHH